MNDNQSYALRDGLPSLPERIKALPVNEQGYPVPFFVAWIDGKPDFRITDPARIRDAVIGDRCWICGQKLGKHRAFVIGPMCTVNRIAPEPPSHADCAVFSAQACPFLSLPRAHRREANMPEGHCEPPGVMLKRNPGVVAIWHTRHYRIMRGPLFQLGEPEDVRWLTQGREATRAEVIASFESGLPALQSIAIEEGPAQVKLLANDTARAMQYLPQ